MVLVCKLEKTLLIKSEVKLYGDHYFKIESQVFLSNYCSYGAL